MAELTRPTVSRRYYAGSLIVATLLKHQDALKKVSFMLQLPNFTIPVDSIEDADLKVLQLMTMKPPAFPEPHHPYANEGFAVVYQAVKVIDVMALPSTELKVLSTIM